MTLHTGPNKVAVSSIVAGQKCPRCGSALVKRPCPCPFKRKGWATCAKCINKKCAANVGLTKRAR